MGIPCLNTPAFEAAARASGIDHLNLNRIFPGDAEGSYSQRLAATFVEQVVPAVDAVVDLHTGGAYGEIAPLVILQAATRSWRRTSLSPPGTSWSGRAASGAARSATPSSKRASPPSPSSAAAPRTARPTSSTT
ncbi:succinylglutamate desuccinylase/aspartoacylase family protein [Streptomyces scabiei]